MNIKSLVRLFVISLALIYLVACTSTTQPGTMGAERKQFMILSQNQFHQQATQDYTMLIGEVKAKGKLKSSPQVTRVTQRLINETPIYRNDVKSWNWYANVIESDSINAFAMHGGKIGVYSGLLNKLKPTDDELAAVIGHEIAHALREHSREKASKAAAGKLTTHLVTSYAGLGEYGNIAVQLAERYAWNLPNSRSAETEADLIGLELMARAGYNPNAAITFWEKMAKANKSSNLAFMSTHPTHAGRIEKIKETIPKVMPYYIEAKGKKGS